MADIEAFHGLRYDLGHVGSLAGVVAPPYDVINPTQQDQLYKRHPANVIRLILNRAEPGDDSSNNPYTRSAKFLKNWRRQGVLKSDHPASVYVYHQHFTFAGAPFVRRGFMARLRLEKFGEGNVYPHEETHAKAKEDRLRLIRQTQANLSQIFVLYPDEANEAQAVLESSIGDDPPVEATDDLGVKHCLWRIDDQNTIADLKSVMGPRPLFIADGHHRYETACNYQMELSQQMTLPVNHPANFVLSMFVSMSDSGMVVLPTHRLFPGLPLFDRRQVRARLANHFDVLKEFDGLERAGQVWTEIEAHNEQGILGLFTPKDQGWLLVQINDRGVEQMQTLAPDMSDQWRQLGVSVLKQLICHQLLQIELHSEPVYVHEVDQMTNRLGEKSNAGLSFQLAVLVMPASISDVRRISLNRERMPQKSTYFYPKLLSGLVINPIE